MLAVTFADLWFRARQFLIAIVGVGLVLALALGMSGLADGFHAEVASTVNAVGADVLGHGALRAGSPDRIRCLPRNRCRRRGAREPGVHRASPVLFAPEQVVLVQGSTAPQTVNLMGVQPGGLGDPQVVSGHRLSATGQAVVDSRVHAPVGTVLELGGHPYDVVGVVDGRTMDGGIPIVYMPLATVQRAVIGGRPLITAVATTGTPATVPAGLVVLTPTAVVTDTVTALGSAVSGERSRTGRPPAERDGQPPAIPFLAMVLAANRGLRPVLLHGGIRPAAVHVSVPLFRGPVLLLYLLRDLKHGIRGRPERRQPCW